MLDEVLHGHWWFGVAGVWQVNHDIRVSIWHNSVAIEEAIRLRLSEWEPLRRLILNGKLRLTGRESASPV